MNKPIKSIEKDFPKTRDDLLNDIDLLEFTEEGDNEEDLNQTLDDVQLEEIDRHIDEYENIATDDNFDELELVYLPCAAHNIQLVVKDGLKLSEKYTILIKKISWIVSKSRNCCTIAEELRRLNKFVAKCVVTRWNSILFMVRSILKITSDEWAEVRNKMNRKTYKEEMRWRRFNISGFYYII